MLSDCNWRSNCCGANVYIGKVYLFICVECKKECKRETLYQEINRIRVYNTPVPGSNGGRDIINLDRLDKYYSGYGIYDYARYLKDHNDL
tara:strand:+ start:64 stop:333 length:270 start_codon:yes stop_codon:yes gene_type:complete